MNTVYWELKESAGQSLFYRQDKMEESPGSIGQGARSRLGGVSLRKVPQKIYRLSLMAGKGEMVR